MRYETTYLPSTRFKLGGYAVVIKSHTVATGSNVIPPFSIKICNCIDIEKVSERRQDEEINKVNGVKTAYAIKSNTMPTGLNVTPLLSKYTVVQTDKRQVREGKLKNK